MIAPRASHLGLIVGLAFGFAVIHYGFVPGVFLAATAVVGWLVGRVLDGDIDVSRYVRPRDRGDLE